MSKMDKALCCLIGLVVVLWAISTWLEHTAIYRLELKEPVETKLPLWAAQQFYKPTGLAAAVMTAKHLLDGLEVSAAELEYYFHYVPVERQTIADALGVDASLLPVSDRDFRLRIVPRGTPLHRAMPGT